MKNVKLLDCTLRDGGRIINCSFPNENIKNISEGLSESNIDIIEIGFLRDKIDYKGNSTFFTNLEQMKPFINRNNKSCIYTAFVDYGMCDLDAIPPYDGTSIDGIRFGFVKSQFDEVRVPLLELKQKGYKLFIQSVNSLAYSDMELLELVDMVNEIKPYGFGIVDTYGAMYNDDVNRIYHLVDHNLSKEISIDFHSHNNFQLSFSFAQDIVKYSTNSRNVIIDTTLNGMGKGAGNLCTELIAEFLNNKYGYDYDLDKIMDIIDGYIYAIKKENDWGYSIPAFMSGIYQAHPNNVIYLTEKLRMGSKDIKNILSLIEPDKRKSYDYNNIENLYINYFSKKVDDKNTLKLLSTALSGNKILVLSPGNNVKKFRSRIDKFINENKNLSIFTVNYVDKTLDAFAFFGNQNRYNREINNRKNTKTIITSNIESDNEKDIIVDYHSVIEIDEKYFDNSVIMLLKLLIKLKISEVAIAGFDGFTETTKNNYIDETFGNARYKGDFSKMNKELCVMIENFSKHSGRQLKLNFITPSQYNKYWNK